MAGALAGYFGYRFRNPLRMVSHFDRVMYHPYQSGSNLFEWGVQGQARYCENTADPWPAFPTDLVSIAIVIATQSSGSALFHDWMYPTRMFFTDKLVSMGANIVLL